MADGMWVLVGLLIGALAKWIMPGPDPRGLVVRMLIGIAGALLGGLVGSFLRLDALDDFTALLVSLALAVFGAFLG